MSIGGAPIASRAIAGAIIPVEFTAALAVQEVGDDTLVASMAVLVEAALDEQEAGNDSASAGADILVTLTAVIDEGNYLGSDVAAFNLGTQTEITMAVQEELDPDIFSGIALAENYPEITVTMTVQEAGADALNIQLQIAVEGDMVAQEGDQDSLVGNGGVLVTLTMAATEVGSDSALFDAFVLDEEYIRRRVDVDIAQDVIFDTFDQVAKDTADR